MSDLIERLRAVDHGSVEDCFLQSPLFEKAADRIEALERQAEELLAKVIEECAKLAEANVFGCTLDVFVFNGVKATNTAGHDTFMSTENVSGLLRKRSAAMRAITMEDIHREQREVPRLRPARPRKPSEAEGREG